MVRTVRDRVHAPAPRRVSDPRQYRRQGARRGRHGATVQVRGPRTGHALRILITAGTELMRSGLASMLGRLPGVTHVQECADPRQAAPLVELHGIGVVVTAPPLSHAEFEALAAGAARGQARTLVVLRDYDLPSHEVVAQVVAMHADRLLLDSA